MVRGVGDHGSEVPVWSPEMEQPLVLHGDHMDPDAVLVDSKLVIEARTARRDGRLEEAEELLRAAVPEVPGVPRFESIEGDRPAVTSEVPVGR